MDEIKVSQLPSASQINNEDLLMIIQNNTNKKVPASEISNITDIRNHSVVVSAVEPSGSARKKVWLQSNENVFDGVLENGSIKSEDGANIDNSLRNRSKNYIEVNSNTTYTLRFDNNAQTIVFEYDTNKIFIQKTSADWVNQPYTFTTSANTKYIRFISYNTSTIKALVKVGNEAPADEMNIIDKTYLLDDDNVYREYAPQQEIYSLTERRIGTWVNGKPLYEKTLYFTSSQYSIGVENTLSLNISNIEDIWLKEAFAKRDRGASYQQPNRRYEFETLPTVHTSQSQWGISVFDINPTTQNFRLLIGSMAEGITFNYIYFTFRYTKTTD